MAKCQHAGCSANATKSGFCFWHDPAKAQERREACVKGGKGRLKQADSVDDTAMDINDIKRVLSGGIRELRASGQDVIGRNRAIGYLASILLSAIQQSDIEARLEALEKKIAS